MMRVPVAALLLVVSTWILPGGAQSPDHPATLSPDGLLTLSKAAEATRVELLGAVEVYSVAVYAEGPPIDRGRLLSPAVPKALRIAVRYKEDLRRQIALDWRRELVPRVDQAAAAHLRGTFAPLQHGNVVLIAYVPDRGTTLRVDKTAAVPDASHDLMLAFLDHLLGQRPVSEELKHALLGGS